MYPIVMKDCSFTEVSYVECVLEIKSTPDLRWKTYLKLLLKILTGPRVHISLEKIY